MARKGGTNHLKRIAAPKGFYINRRQKTWLAKPSPGSHSQSQCITLLNAVRDLLGVASDAREARIIIRTGKVLVDGRIVKDDHFPIGLMDVVSIPALKSDYRALVDGKQRIFLRKISPDEAKFKYCKVNSKKTVSKGKFQMGLHDGRSILLEKQCAVGSTLKLAVPKAKVEEALELKPGATVFVSKGRHAGKLAELASIVPGTATRDSEAVLKGEAGEFTTVWKYLFAVEKGFKVNAE